MKNLNIQLYKKGDFRKPPFFLCAFFRHKSLDILKIVLIFLRLRFRTKMYLVLTKSYECVQK